MTLAQTRVTAPFNGQTATHLQPVSPSTSGAPLFVWGVWALTLAIALNFVREYGGNALVDDEWFFYVPYLTGEEPNLLAWLWAAVFDHRHPLPKLYFLTLYGLTHDERTAMFLLVSFLGILAFAMIRTAQKIRGWLRYSDAFFPLVLLNLGHAETLVWCFQACFVGPFIVAAGTALLLMLSHNRFTLSPRAAVAAGICLLCLAACGPLGLAYVPALGLWLGRFTVPLWRHGNPWQRLGSLVVLMLLGLALLLAALYVLDFQKHPDSSRTTLFRLLSTMVAFWAVGFGAAAECYWPVARWGVLCLMLCSTLGLGAAWIGQRSQRGRVVGLAFFLGGVASLAAAIGWARAEFPGHGLQARYTVMAVPFACWAYFVWVVCGRPLGNVMQMALYSLAVVMIPANTGQGLAIGEIYREKWEGFEQDVRVGMPLGILAQRRGPALIAIGEPEAPRLTARGLAGLRRQGISPYDRLREDPDMRETAAVFEPFQMNNMTWEEGVGQGLGDRPTLGLTLKERRFVYAIRFKFAYEEAAPTAKLVVSWRDGEKPGGSDRGARDAATFKSWSHTQTWAVWVNDPIGEFTIRLDAKVKSFRVSEVVLLTP